MWARFNEEQELRERYRKFNVDGLKRVAKEALGDGSCISISKHTEGANCKVFSLVMEDGFEAFAKLLAPTVVPGNYVISSEVATLDFLRSELSVPVPHVYGWNTNTSPDVNPVEAEFILMEKIRGVCLNDIWMDLTGYETMDILKQFVQIETKFFTRPLSAYGSIYYRDSLPRVQTETLFANPEHNNKGNSRFCVGPSAYRAWRYNERAVMDIDRGPCNDSPPRQLY